MKEDLKDISANRTSVSEGGEEFYNSRVSLLSVWELSDSSVPQLCREAPRRGWAQICPQPAVGKVEGGPTPPFLAMQVWIGLCLETVWTFNN